MLNMGSNKLGNALLYIQLEKRERKNWIKTKFKNLHFYLNDNCETLVYLL